MRHATRLLSAALDTGEVEAAAIVDPERQVLQSRFDELLEDVVEVAGTARPIFRDVSPPVRLLDLDFERGRLLILPTGLSTLVLRTGSGVDAGRLLDALSDDLATFAEADRRSTPPGGEAGDLAAWFAAHPSELDVPQAGAVPGGLGGGPPAGGPETVPAVNGHHPSPTWREPVASPAAPAGTAPDQSLPAPGLAAAPTPVYEPPAGLPPREPSYAEPGPADGTPAAERQPATEPREALVEVMNRLSRIAAKTLGGPVVRNYLKKSQGALTDEHPALAPFAIDLKGTITCSALDEADPRELGPAVRAWADAFLRRAAQVVPELDRIDLGELTDDLASLLEPNGFPR